jgi:hypothetical protein
VVAAGDEQLAEGFKLALVDGDRGHWHLAELRSCCVTVP